MYLPIHSGTPFRNSGYIERYGEYGEGCIRKAAKGKTRKCGERRTKEATGKEMLNKDVEIFRMTCIHEITGIIMIDGKVYDHVCDLDFEVCCEYWYDLPQKECEYFEEGVHGV